jgi:SPX domain protein involved in polyphosphate accumulation
MQHSRYERKFFLTVLDDKQLETIIKLHPAIFSEIYHQRMVNSLYYDNRSLDFYQDNVQGSHHRLKIRLRWYQDLKKVINPNLELKIKNGLLGDKRIISCNSFNLAKGLMKLNSLIADRSNFEKITSLKTNNLKPVILISYNRRYFQSADKKYRLTLDRDLTFYKVDGNRVNWQTKLAINSTILELKYDEQDDNDADQISAFFPFRMTKLSKYVLGMSKLNFKLKS